MRPSSLSSPDCHSLSSSPRHLSLASRVHQRKANARRLAGANGAAATAAAASGPRYSAAVAVSSCWLARARLSRSTRSTPTAPLVDQASSEAPTSWLKDTDCAPRASRRRCSHDEAAVAPSRCTSTCRAKIRAAARSIASVSAGCRGGNSASTCTIGQFEGGGSVRQSCTVAPPSVPRAGNGASPTSAPIRCPTWRAVTVTAAPRVRRARLFHPAVLRPSSPASVAQG